MKPTDNKNENINKKGQGGCSPLDALLILSIMGAVLDEVEEELNEAPEDKPSAMDLLSKSERTQMAACLSAYGCLREYIDDEYVALLIALSQYERIDIDAKVKEHIAKNILKKG